MSPIPKMLSDGLRKLAWVPTIADTSAPKLTELAATGSLDISCLVTAADFTLGATGEDTVNDPPLCAVGNDVSPGRVNFEAGMNFFRWTTTVEDKAWNLFTDKGMGGFLVQRIGKKFTEAFAVGDKVQVYDTITGRPMILSPNGGGFEKFRQNFYVQSGNTNERATVVA